MGRSMGLGPWTVGQPPLPVAGVVVPEAGGVVAGGVMMIGSGAAAVGAINIPFFHIPSLNCPAL